MINKPIGLLDSGAGGLTVLKAVKEGLPNESFVYIGDTARCPYGNRSDQEIIQYTLELVQFLMEKDVKMIVIACNTATAQALETVRSHVSVPVIGVISPGSKAAVDKTKTKEIGVIATKSTIESGFYEKTIHRFNPEVAVSNLACPSFVDLVENNEYKTDKAKAIVKAKLAPFKTEKMDTLILGCTHFPLLSSYIQEAMGEDVTLVDSGALTSEKIHDVLSEERLLAGKDAESTIQLFTTDKTPELFKKIAVEWLETERLDVEAIPLERLTDLNE